MVSVTAVSSLCGATIFSKVALSQEYAQLPLAVASQELRTIATHRGLFTYNRLPFGVSSAPAIWQKIIEQILVGVDGVVVYFCSNLPNVIQALPTIQQQALALRGLSIFFTD